MNTGKIFQQIPKIMTEVGAIEKTRTNTQGNGYKFRGIDDVYQALQSPLAKHGVFYAPKVLKAEREERQSKSGGNLIYTVLHVEFKFYADDGSSFETVTVGEAMDSGDKSANKAMSAALKYALLQLFCIPTQEDNDTENHSPEPLPRINHAPSVQRTQPGRPIQRPVVQNQFATSGVFCEICNEELNLTRDKSAYSCVNWQNKSQGNHSYVRAHEYEDFKARQQEHDSAGAK